jgi:hypothetical protein
MRPFAATMSTAVLAVAAALTVPATADAPDPATQAALLARGYALAGSSYDPDGSEWALGSAARDQCGTLAAVEAGVLPGHPRQVLAFGTSMGGLVSALEAQDGAGLINGALTTCGIVAGAINLNEYQLDGEYALAQLLLPGQQIKLVRFTGVNDALATAAALQAAFSGSFSTLDFIEAGRPSIDQASGGSANWTRGTNFAAVLARSPYLGEVTALYRAAGLSLLGDLGTLTRNADIAADPGAVASLERTSVPTGRLAVPELDLHTISDQLVPVQQENFYAERVAAAGSGGSLRQAYSAWGRPGSFPTIPVP